MTSWEDSHSESAFIFQSRKTNSLSTMEQVYWFTWQTTCASVPPLLSGQPTFSSLHDATNHHSHLWSDLDVPCLVSAPAQRDCVMSNSGSIKHQSSTLKMASKSAKHPMSLYLQQNQDRIFENNRNWVASKLAADSSFFEKLSSGQHPDYLWASPSVPSPARSVCDDEEKAINGSIDTSDAAIAASPPTRSWASRPERCSCTATLLT